MDNKEEWRIGKFILGFISAILIAWGFLYFTSSALMSQWAGLGILFMLAILFMISVPILFFFYFLFRKKSVYFSRGFLIAAIIFSIIVIMVVFLPLLPSTIATIFNGKY